MKRDFDGDQLAARELLYKGKGRKRYGYELFEVRMCMRYQF